ncbi:MAG: hypothetical protein RIC19_03130 [Phaeodactylibacter sp.]|uniref:LVIVD repeat-containing protein n=1 Tax=Phaeodactylibacter sp. TaxID=1940289 RepID=UPI0032EBE020
MKNFPTFYYLIGLLSLSLALPSCVQDSCEATVVYQGFEPVYAKPENFRLPIEYQPPRHLENPGKIYVYQDILLINEREEGVHIINNSNPSSPVPIGFVEIPGNVDMAVRGNMLYADNYVDLVAIDLTNPESPVFAGRTEDAIPHQGYDEELGYLIRYDQIPVTEEVPCDQYAGVSFRRGGTIFIDVAAGGGAFDLSNESSGQAQDVGVGGSMARFTLAQDHLYVVDEYNLHVFGLAAPKQPEKLTTVNVGWGIETLFPYGDKLFIGANNGMYIFDNSVPTAPVQLSLFQHATACDPVFVDGNTAYVTLRDGQECETFTNQLDVVDITSLTNPVLIKSFEMHNPHGLSKLNNALYICENEQGVKIFDATNPETIGSNQIGKMTGFQAYDIITLQGDLAIVIGEDGLYQYDISDPAAPRRLSNLLSL